ncbi:MAG: hypothetical protein ACTSRH_01860 [Promethearchaeota archaeon]
MNPILKITVDFYNLLNGTSREDIQLILRPSLDHFANEEDLTSFILSIAWFKYFYINKSIIWLIYL